MVERYPWRRCSPACSQRAALFTEKKASLSLCLSVFRLAVILSFSVRACLCVTVSPSQCLMRCMQRESSAREREPRFRGAGAGHFMAASVELQQAGVLPPLLLHQPLVCTTLSLPPPPVTYASVQRPCSLAMPRKSQDPTWIWKRVSRSRWASSTRCVPTPVPPHPLPFSSRMSRARAGREFESSYASSCSARCCRPHPFPFPHTPPPRPSLAPRCPGTCPSASAPRWQMETRWRTWRTVSRRRWK